MKKSCTIYLIAETFNQNEYGVLEPSVSARTVYARMSSVSGQEWFEGGRQGLNPQYRFTVFAHDYKGEKVVEYENIRYTVYRVYHKSVDEVELYTELKMGNE